MRESIYNHIKMVQVIPSMRMTERTSNSSNEYTLFSALHGHSASKENTDCSIVNAEHLEHLLYALIILCK